MNRLLSTIKAVFANPAAAVCLVLIAAGGVYLIYVRQGAKSYGHAQLPPIQKTMNTSKGRFTADEANLNCKPRSESVESVVEQSLEDTSISIKSADALPNESMTADLELPEAFTPHQIDREITRAEMIKVWQAQDKVMNSWPPYSQLSQKLHDELAAKPELQNGSDDELVQRAAAFRSKFWKEGGCMSEASYNDAYLARAILEYAHQRNPQNHAITDELVETIQSATVMRRTDSDTAVAGDEYLDTILNLRLEQFDLIKTETEGGYLPVWEDFVRATDLAILYGESENFDAAGNVVEWLIQQADTGGWTAYLKPLERMQHNFSQHTSCMFSIYTPLTSGITDEFRYARRLPSFKGPDPDKRGVTALHLAGPYPVWKSKDEVR
jgi:hypothetical protein